MHFSSFKSKHWTLWLHTTKKEREEEERNTHEIIGNFKWKIKTKRWWQEIITGVDHLNIQNGTKHTNRTSHHERIETQREFFHGKRERCCPFCLEHVQHEIDERVRWPKLMCVFNTLFSKFDHKRYANVSSLRWQQSNKHRKAAKRNFLKIIKRNHIVSRSWTFLEVKTIIRWIEGKSRDNASASENRKELENLCDIELKKAATTNFNVRHPIKKLIIILCYFCVRNAHSFLEVSFITNNNSIESDQTIFIQFFSSFFRLFLLSLEFLFLSLSILRKSCNKREK